MKKETTKKSSSSKTSSAPTAPFQYRTPAGVQDLTNQPVLQQMLNKLWNQNLNGFNQQGIVGNVWNATNTPALTNYYNPLAGVPEGQNNGPVPINWSAFPGRLAYNYPTLSQATLNELADTGAMTAQISNSPCDTQQTPNAPYYPYGPRGWQDEYCEWAVTRRSSDNKITRIDFTCENPEYWNSLWKINSAKVLELYQTILNKPQIILDDLSLPNTIDPSTGQPYYNPLNKWNTGTASGSSSGGAIHLTSTPNTLQTEIGISSAATVLRTNPNPPVPTQPTIWSNPSQNNPLLCFAQYGQKFRNSDPTIGNGINGNVNDGLTLSLTNPPGLYIQMPNFTQYSTPKNTDGTQTPASQFWNIVRGVETLNDESGNVLPGNFILHAVFEVPESYGYTISDIQINGVNIDYGSQVAATFLMQVLADAYPAPMPQAYGAVGAPAVSLAQPLQLFYQDYYTSMYNTMIPNPVNNPISELSNSTYIAPDILPLSSNKTFVLTCATCTATAGKPETYPSVTFDDPNITATVTSVVNNVSYAVPGNSLPNSISSNPYTSLYINISTGLNAAIGTHGIYVTNVNQAKSVAMPALLNVTNIIQRTVASNVAWQDTGITITSQTPAVTINYLSGLWTANPHDNGGKLYDANGNPQFIEAKPGYTMPGKDEGALIGMVGTTTFLVGNNIQVPTGLTGKLLLCINDDLNGTYGSGLRDNIGSITVGISIDFK
jgi:hypothetical protein